MDEQIGRLRALLKEKGVDQDTVLFFCSDNGPDGGSHYHGEYLAGGTKRVLRGRVAALPAGLSVADRNEYSLAREVVDIDQVGVSIRVDMA